MGNSVDIVIRAVEKGVATTFSKLVGSLKTGKLALDAFKQTMDRTSAAASTVGNTLNRAFAAISTGVAVKGLWDAGVASQRLNLAFEAIGGSAKAATDELAFVRAESERLGLVFPEVAESYKKIFAAATAGNIPLETSRKIFSGMSEGFVALGMDGERVKLSLQAVAQMMGKNQVMAEELKQQLGEHFPVAIQYFARAAGVSVLAFFDMMKAGEVGIDTLKKASDLISADFGPKAEEAANMAIGSLSKFQTAWFDLKTLIANSGFLAAATNALKTLTNSMKDPEVQKNIAEWSKKFFDLASAILKVAWEWKGFILATAGTVKVLEWIGAIYLGLKGLGAAVAVITGSSFIAWLGSLRAAFIAVQASAVYMTGVLGAVYLAMVYDIQKIIELVNNYRELKKIQSEIAALQIQNAKANSELAKKFAEISAATGVTVGSMKELDAAVKAGKLRFDETVGAWVAGSKKMSAATVTVTDEMKKKYEEYARKVIALRNEIAGKTQSLAEKLRSMGREGMTDLGAWRDQKREAEEYFAVARKAKAEMLAALAAGDEKLAQKKFDEGKAAAEKAETAYEGLSNTVDSNGKAVVSLADGLKTRMEGVEAAGKLGLEIMQAMEKATSDAAVKLDKSVGGELAKALPEIAKSFGELNVSAAELAEQSEAFNKAWNEAYDDFLEKGTKTIYELDNRLTELTKDRYITVHVKEVVEKFAGGLVNRLASGGFPRLSGKLPGSDGPDSIRAMLAPGEFIMRSAAVRKYGAALFHALNSMRLDVGSLIGSRISGAMSKITVPQLAPVRMFDGGMVPAMAGSTGDTINFNVSIAGQASPAQQANARQLAKMVYSEWERMYRGRP